MQSRCYLWFYTIPYYCNAYDTYTLLFHEGVKHAINSTKRQPALWNTKCCLPDYFLKSKGKMSYLAISQVMPGQRKYPLPPKNI